MVHSESPSSGPDSTKAFDWKAFSQKTWVVVVAGLALPPVGMILAWLKQDWTNRTKWIAIGVFGLLLIGRMLSKPEAPVGKDGDSLAVEAPTTGTQSRKAAPATLRPSSNQAISAEEPTGTAAHTPSSLPVPRHWFESDQSYLTRGVAELAKTIFSSEEAVCELAAASSPWKGFRGKVRLDSEQHRVEVHPSGNTFIVVFYSFSTWLGFPAEFYDAAGKKLTSAEFCKRAYRKTTDEVKEIFDAEQDKHQSAKSLWNLATNEAALRKRLPGRFTVEGTAFEVKHEYGAYRVRLFVHENERGVDRWVECVMTDRKGLDTLTQGATVTIEGKFSKTTPAGPEMKDCHLVE